MSRLLRCLEEQLRNSRTPREAAEPLSRQACYFARSGNSAEAKAIAEHLRSRFGSADARIAAWIMLIEGLVGYFEALKPEALDRIQRAALISQAAGQLDIYYLASTWLANSAF